MSLALCVAALGTWATTPRSDASPPHADRATVVGDFDLAPSPGTIVTPGLDVANPFVVRRGGRYLVYSTQALFANVPLRTGDRLDRLAPPIDVLPELPPWARLGYTWAPDVRQVGDRWVLWFTAGLRGGRLDAPNASQCIGVAVADRPEGPFRSAAEEPAICQLDRWGSIDPRTFLDADGSLWIHWKSDDNARAGSDRPAAIYGQRLAADGTTLLGEPQQLIEADQRWEGTIVEAPQLVLEGGRYWLFYSANWFNQPAYGVGVAECEGPAGPCTKPLDRPWLASNRQGRGPGEASLFRDELGWSLVYSPRSVEYAEPTRRPLAVGRVDFDERGPRLAARSLRAAPGPLR